jgi:predicted  nucleic acid-binding Zn-ribbon protein
MFYVVLFTAILLTIKRCLMNADETQIHADIEALRATVTETQALYREVCAILFFRYGVTPTANKLYQYVRKGSMSAPAEALARFWDELREKSRVRIEYPDLPEAVKAAASDLVESLWAQAQAAAKEGLEVFRVEAQADILAAQTEKESAENARNTALRELSQLRQMIQVATDRTLELEREVVAERTSKEALFVQLDAAGHQQAVLEGALTEARRDFTSELEKLRHALQRSVERLESSEKRALLEIDRERTATSKIQKEMAQLRQTQQVIADDHRTEVAKLQRELGEAAQKLGMAEGTLQELRTIHQQQVEQTHALRGMLGKRDTENELLRRDLEASQSRVAKLMTELRQLQKPCQVKAEGVKGRKPRKPLSRTVEHDS